jgi:MFS family permease
MIAPALPEISKQFGITESVEMSLTLSVFVLAYAIGPLILVGYPSPSSANTSSNIN